MSWAVGIMLAWGAICLVHGYRVRSGRSRTFYPSYRTNVMWRNAPFALLALGIWLIAGAAAIVLSDAGIEAAGGVFALIAFVALMVSLVWLFKPPEFMKPRWLRQVESGAATEPEQAVIYGAPSPSGARRLYLPRVVYWGLWAVTIAVFVLWLALEWPPSVLVGLGGAISLLAAHTPKKRDVA
jgi:hypothetical protein